jgi:transcriptional regulator GlxA family with amidase domain
MLEAVQLSDIVGIDIFGNLSTEYFAEMVTIEPRLESFRDQAMDITFYYIASTLDPAPITPGIKFAPNTTYDDCPRNLDIVFIGGPHPSHRPAAADKFLKEAWDQTPVFFTTCIGSLWLASSGVMKGLSATTNRGALSMARTMLPDIEWLDQRWVVASKPYGAEGGEGQLWTSGGAGCGKSCSNDELRLPPANHSIQGIEMVARYCLEKFDPKFVNALALQGLDFDPEGSRGQFYQGPPMQY